MSSVAYAPQEIFLVLSVAGLTAYAYTPWVALAVAVVLAVVVVSYRQNVHAYPSGGGDYEVATVNLGPRAGLVVGSSARRLCADRRGIDRLGDRERRIRGGPGAPPQGVVRRGGDRAARRGQPARIAGIGRIPGHPDLPVHRQHRGDARMGFRARALRLRHPRRDRRFRCASRTRAHWAGFAMVFPVGARLLVGLCAADRCGGHQQRVPAFRKPKSRNAATTLLLPRRLSITLLMGLVPAGA